MTPGRWLVRLAIALYPRSFRDRFGDEMVGVYLEQVAERQGWGRVARTAATVAGLLRALPGVHLEERTRRRRQRSVAGSGRRFPPAGVGLMDHLRADLPRTLRGLAARPGFAVVAILTLALGIGANTAVFSVLNRVVLAPLPYAEPEQLVRVYVGTAGRPEERQYLTGLDVRDLMDDSTAFAAVGALYTYRETGRDLTPPGEPPRRVRVLGVSAGYFRALRASPALGRTFVPDEDREHLSLVVLSHRLWRELTGGDPSIVGRTVTLSGQAFEVIGVMRPGFRDLAGDDVLAWMPTNLERGGENNRGNYYLSAVARLRPGVTLAQAQARLDAIADQQAPEYPNFEGRRLLVAVPLLADVVGASRGPLILLMVAAGLVLLIACLNVANLFLARSIAQTRELAVRTALGANRPRLVWERLLESFVVALIGGAAGSAVASWGVRALLAVSPESLARSEEVGFDGRLLLFAVGVTAVTALLFGGWPAWRASRVDPTEALRDGARGVTGGRSRGRARDLVVAAQMAVALMLLTGAGMLVRSFVSLQRVDLGFAPERLATFELNLPVVRYGEAGSRVRFHETFLARLRQIPGVTAVGAVSWLPANGMYHFWGFGFEQADGSRGRSGAQFRVVDGDYFAAMGIPVVAGRTFIDTDGRDSVGAAIVSHALAKAAWGDADPIGRILGTGSRPYRVVGVVGDVATNPAGDKPGIIYLSHAEFADDRNWTLNYVVRSTMPPAAVFEPAGVALAAVDPSLVLFRPRSVAEILAGHRARERFTLLLMGVFAVVAVSLAAIGLYGVLSYTVSQRDKEIGVRMALGARPGQVRAAVLGHAARIAAVGAGVGLVGAWIGGRVIDSLVVGTDGRDPLVLGGVLVVLAGVVGVAGYVPARRATRIDPLTALRRE
ncbi:MAG: ABC transporter permease [Gemmatimonadales bacterium]